MRDLVPPDGRRFSLPHDFNYLDPNKQLWEAPSGLIVDGAVGMVEMALERLKRNNVVELDDEKKAAMVSNLLVVLCGERAATPVLNTGTLHQ